MAGNGASRMGSGSVTKPHGSQNGTTVTGRGTGRGPADGIGGRGADGVDGREVEGIGGRDVARPRYWACTVGAMEVASTNRMVATRASFIYIGPSSAFTVEPQRLPRLARPRECVRDRGSLHGSRTRRFAGCRRGSTAS